MAAEREPPPLGDGKPSDFEEQEDGEDLFTSTVSTLEVRPRHRVSGVPPCVLPFRWLFPALVCPSPPPCVCKDLMGKTPVTGTPPGAPVSGLDLAWVARPRQTRRRLGV